MKTSITQAGPNLFRALVKPPAGELGRLLGRFDPHLVIGHPTFRCAGNLPSLIARDLEAARMAFPGRRVAVIVSDGTLNDRNADTSDIDAAMAGAQAALDGFPPAERGNVFVYAGPHPGYHTSHRPSGKGDALKMIFDEMAPTRAQAAILLDGDLRNDMVPWFAVYRRVMDEHQAHFPGENFFVTARYARHFVDASLTRNVVGPLTTLLGSYVPGGISGDIMLSAGAVAKERSASWDAARRTYGTDIATTFDNIADPATRIYDVYLGAKLHDVTDDAKLSVMPGQVIGAALERLLHYEALDRRVTRRLAADLPLDDPVVWDSERTGIGFIDPGTTGVFDVDAKRKALVEKLDQFRPDLQQTLRPASFQELLQSHRTLSQALQSGTPELVFLGVTRERWIALLYEVLGYVLATRDPESAQRALNYLYTAAFVEFCGEKLQALGLDTLPKVRAAQARLGVPARQAEAFYAEKVEQVVRDMALGFYRGRAAVLERMRELGK